MSNLFSFPYYFYSSLCCPKEKFIKAWNSIPVENKKDINIRAAVGMTCIKLSDDLFYKDFNLSECNVDRTFGSKCSFCEEAFSDKELVRIYSKNFG